MAPPGKWLIYILRLFDKYFEHVHCWYPFLDPTTTYDLLNCLTPEQTPSYALFLMILALGSLSEDRSTAKGQQFAEQYAQPAFALSPMNLASDDMASTQCFILYSYIIFYYPF
jgi:hypothetical protein